MPWCSQSHSAAEAQVTEKICVFCACARIMGAITGNQLAGSQTAGFTPTAKITRSSYAFQSNFWTQLYGLQALTYRSSTRTLTPIPQARKPTPYRNSIRLQIMINAFWKTLLANRMRSPQWKLLLKSIVLHALAYTAPGVCMFILSPRC